MMDITSLDAIYSVQKMAEVLVVGPDSEREFILFELQQLLDHCLEDTMKILIPVLCEHVPKWNIDLQIKSAQRLYDVVCLDLDPATANMITCASFGVIHRSKGRTAPEYEELYNLWGGLLVDCLPNMQWSPQEIKDVVTLVDIHSKESLYTSRKVAARVIGALAQCLDKNKVEKVILPRAIQLFDDTDVEVRGTAVESLAMIGSSLPVRVTESEVWPRIEALLEPPEEARIRATAMRTMAHILEAHRSSTGQNRLFRELLPPVFARLAVFARKYSAEDQRLVHDDTYLLLEVVSEVFGQFAFSLSLFTKKTFRKEAYKAYAGMATCNGPLIRRNCAFNLPGVAKALGERYALELSGLCDYLANDMDEQVRWILAAGIHETVALLVPRGNFERLFGAVCALLQDESPMVRMNALAHFHDLLTAFAKDGSDPASLRRLAPVFADLTMLSEGEWRIQRSLAEQLGKCADIIPPDALLDNVLPLLYRLTKQGTPLVREAAMDATAKSLRNIPVVKDRNSALERYWKAASKGPFWMRLALLDGGSSAMKVFSHKRFAELFAGEMLRLANDPVANVRIRLASLLADMAPMCMGSAAYVKALEILQKDSDMDVAALMRKHEETVRTAVRTSRERQSDDQTKYRDEQEFYGLAHRTQKRARGRLASTKGNRIIMHVRRPSIEQSSGQLSVSRAVITAAKASSAAASALKTGYHIPRLPEADSAVYLSASMEEVSGDVHDGLQVEGEGLIEEHGGGVQVQDRILTSLAGRGPVVMANSNGVVDMHGSGAPLLLRNGSNGLDERHKGRLDNGPGSSSIAVVQQASGRSARYEARSKSWNGIIAQFPRQLSMESRNRKSGKNGEEGGSSGWHRTSKDNGAPKRKLSSLRRKKKRGDVPDSGSEVYQAAVDVVEYASSGNARVVAARAKSMVQPSLHDSNGGSLPPSVGLTEVGSIPTESDAVRKGLVAENSRWRSQHAQGSELDMLCAGEGAHSLSVDYEEEGVLPAFKGHAPWLRQKHDDENLEALSEAAHRKAFGVGEFGASSDGGDDLGRSGKQASGNGKLAGVQRGGFASGASVSGSSAISDFSIVPGGDGFSAAARNVSVDGGSVRDGDVGSGGNGGFLRGLFRRRR